MTFSDFEAKEIKTQKIKPNYFKLGYEAFNHNASLPLDKDYWWKAITFETYKLQVDTPNWLRFANGFSKAGKDYVKTIN